MRVPTGGSTDLVLAEPLVAARIASIANSVAYSRYGRNFSNVRPAVGKFGLNRLRGVVAAVVIGQLSDDISDASIRNKVEQLQCTAYPIPMAAWAAASPGTVARRCGADSLIPELIALPTTRTQRRIAVAQNASSFGGCHQFH